MGSMERQICGIPHRGNRLRVVLAVPSLLAGGAERFVVDLASRLDQTKLQPIVLVTGGDDCTPLREELMSRQVGIVSVDGGSRILVGVRVARALAALRPDVVHTNLGSLLHCSLGVSIARKSFVKVHTMHSMAGFGERGYRRPLTRSALRAFGFTPVAVSAAVGRSIQEVYRISAGAVQVIPNGVDLDKFPPRIKVKSRFDPVVFVSVGSLKAVKNHGLLINAFREIARESKSVRLRIVGGGPLYDELRALIDEYDLIETAEVIGHISDVVEELAQADAYVSSSLIEGMPIAILEAMSSGLPVVATRAGGVEDLVVDGVNGYTVAIGDCTGLAKAMRILAVDADLRGEMGRASRRVAERFSIDTMVKRYETLYDGLFSALIGRRT